MCELAMADVCLQHGSVCVTDIGILVGADFYWTIVSGEQRIISYRLSAISTRLGRTLQGPSVTETSKEVEELT